jgi:hypothetical protein
MKITDNSSKMVTTCYADDVTIFVSTPDDIPKLEDALCQYERATGAKINTLKSKALPLAGWPSSQTVLGIPYTDRLTILGLTFANTVQLTRDLCWKHTTDIIRAHARTDYARVLNMHSRIHYIHEHLYSRAWYLAQMLPPPGDCIRQLTTTITYFLWQGKLFRVPVMTIQRSKAQGGWELLNILAKCRSILFIRLQSQLMGANSTTTS